MKQRTIDLLEFRVKTCEERRTIDAVDFAEQALIRNKCEMTSEEERVFWRSLCLRVAIVRDEIIAAQN